MENEKPTNDSENKALTESAGFIPEEIQQAIEKMPPESKRELISMISWQASVIKPPENELYKKITPEHLSASIANEAKAMEYQHEDAKQLKLLIIAVLIIGVITILSLTIMLKDTQPQLLKEILIALISATFGGLGGYGLGKGQR